jgi:hypothetical protein
VFPRLPDRDFKTAGVDSATALRSARNDCFCDSLREVTVTPFRVCLNVFRVYSVSFGGNSFVTVRTPGGRVCVCVPARSSPSFQDRWSGFRDCASLRAE